MGAISYERGTPVGTYGRRWRRTVASSRTRVLTRLLHRSVQRFRGGLVFKAHILCVSLNSRLESNQEEEKKIRARSLSGRTSPFIVTSRYRGTSLKINSSPPQDHRRALGIGLL